MNIFENLVINDDKPSILSIKKNDKTNLFAVGLKEKQVLAKHRTTIPATLMLLKGRVDFNITNESITLKEGDIFEIPINIEHEVIGRDLVNIFIIVKEL